MVTSLPAGNSVFAIGWPNGNASTYRPIVYDPATFKIYIRDDGFSGTCSAASFTVESGVITSC